MSKTFNVEIRQEWAQAARVNMAGGRYKHYKGGLYVVENVVVDEATGELLVIYHSDRGYVWARPLSVFRERVADGVWRFTEVK